MGDFNEILDGAESSRFDNMSRISCGMREFQSLVLHCQLTDLGYQGPLYTWCNKREEGVICKKLDRFLLNEVALRRFSNAYSVFEPGGCSDHLRCKVQLFPPNEKIRRPFNYVNAVASLPEFLPMVESYWSNTERLFHSTSAMFRFAKKLKNLKQLIRDLGRNKLGNLTKRAKEAMDILSEKQKNTLENPRVRAVQEESEAYGKWLHVSTLEEDFLKQRAKLHWLDVGDQNNKTFHRAIKTRQAQNLIREIRDANGCVRTKHSEIKQEAEKFFSDLLNQKPVSYQGVEEDELQELLRFRCSSEDCRHLEEEVTEE